MARSFNGTSDFIDLGTSGTLQLLSGNPFTISAWIYPTLSTIGFVIARDDSTTRGFAFGTQTDKIYAELNGSALFSGSGPTLNHNVWWHLLWTGSGSGYTVTGYVNGASANSGTGTAASSGSQHTTIGERIYSGVTDNFPGNIADVAWWNVQLSALEILALAGGARPSGIRRLALVGWWPLDGLQSPEPDLSGSKFNGTLTGTASVFGPPLTPFTRRWPQFNPPAVAAVPLFLMPQIVT